MDDPLMQADPALQEVAEPSRWKSAWAVRAYLSTLGQSLLFISGIKTAGNASDRHALVGFAGVNLLANAINALFGGQKKEDTHQLRYLKEKINDELAPLVSNPAAMPPVDATLVSSKGRKDGESQAHYLLQKYSVTLSEFILRTTGSLSLIAPITGWGKAFRNVRGGMSIGEAFTLARTKNLVTFGAGLFSLSGKGFILMASEPDPYRPEPMTLWRTLRERVMFRMSSIVEVISSACMGHDRFTRQKIKINGELRPDYLGAVGNASIITGYIPRWIAPYGTREVPMPELYAHVAEGLRALPAEKVAPMLEQISGELAEHFKAKRLQAATIKAEIEQRMRQPSLRVEPHGQHAKLAATTEISRG